jgi:RND family efflux transporter MFP subunit
MKKSMWMAGVAAVILVGGGAWYWHGKQAAQAMPAAVPADTSSVQVQTAMPARHPMAVSMTVFGDVASIKVSSLSFPQAGQLVRLAVMPGQAVHKGDIVAVLASDPAAVTAYTQAATAVTFARNEEQRLRELQGLQLATSSQVDAAAKQARDAETALAGQAKLGGGQASAELRADVDGVVMATLAAQGDRVAAGAAIVQVGRTDALRVNLAIEPARASEVRPGMDVTFDGPPAFKARVASVQNVIDPKTMMAAAVVLLPAPGPGWPVGMRVQAVIALGQRDAWELPRQAVLVDDAGAYIFQVAGGKARRVSVKKIVETAATIGVDGALDARQPVVVLGNYELKDGMPVRGSQP